MRFDSSVGDGEAKKVHLSFSELEFFGVKDTSSTGTLGQECTDPGKIGGNVVIPEERVINTVLVVLHVPHNEVHAVGIPVPSTDEALWAGPVLILAPLGQKLCQVSVSWVNWHAMIAVPVIKDGFDLATRDGRGNGVGRLGMVGLPGGMLVDLGIVDDPAGGTIMLWGDNHPATPGVRSVDWDAFNNSKPLISFKTSLHISHPVRGYHTG